MVNAAMTIKKVAAYLSVNEKTVYRMAQKGGLPGFKVSGSRHFKQDDIDTWIERQKEAAQKTGGCQ